jgi:hypothetical protein
MSAEMRVNRAAARSYGVTRESSNTLQSHARGRGRPLRGELIEAAVQAIATGSNPRLVRTLTVP